MDACLYDPTDGFFVRGGAGRAGRDFVTSPEVGALFGALVARALDGFWERLEYVDPYLVVEAGAGRGQLARDVLRAQPACRAALRYVLVEQSAALRDEQGDGLAVEPPGEVLGPVLHGADPDEPPLVLPGLGPVVTQLPELPAGSLTGVVVANELLDNLPFGVVERTTTGWCEVRVATDGDAFVEVLVPARDALVADLPDGVAPGSRLPVQSGVAGWLVACAATLRRGYLVIVDYAAEPDELAARPSAGWLRTYAAHGPAGDPLAHPGEKDITADVDLAALRRAASRAGFIVERELSQRQWLEELGVATLVDEARRTWEERGGIGDLPALAARSRVSEASALLDESGLGAHRVAVLRRV
jgi:SAM-dependent MidA family methyltransferase